MNLTFNFRSEEHTSELQSRENLVCRLLLEKKKYVSIRFPFSLSNVSTNVWASQGAGAGCAVGLVQLIAMAIEGALMLPLGVFFVVGTATSEIYTLSLHDALPI